MRAIAALEIVMRPSGDASACPASTTGLTCAGPSGLREEQLGPAVLVGPGDPCGREARLERELLQLGVGVEMTARRERIRRRHGALRLRRGRVDRDPAVRREDAA